LEDAGRGKYDVGRLLAGGRSTGEAPTEQDVIDVQAVKRLEAKRAA
jgi:hypothetical protein